MELRVKTLKKGEVLVQRGEFLKNWIFVSKGSLRIDKDVVFSNTNTWPACAEKDYSTDPNRRLIFAE